VQRGVRRVSVAKVFAASSEGWCVLVPVFLFLFLCFKVHALRRMSASVGFGMGYVWFGFWCIFVRFRQ
jgi:hypothetical protein